MKTIKKHSKSIAICTLTGFILFFSFFVPLAYSSTPNNPILIEENTWVNLPCGASCNSGSLSTPNPSVRTGDGLVLAINCASSSTSVSAAITSVTDSIGDVWVKGGSIPTTSGAFAGGNAQKWFSGEIWYTNIVSTVATTITVTTNFSPNAGNCYSVLYLCSNYGMQFFTVSGSSSAVKVSNNIFGHNLKQFMTTSPITQPSNIMVLEFDWLNSTQTDPVGAESSQNLGDLFSNNVGLGTGSSWLHMQFFYGFYPTTTNPTDYEALWTSTSSPANAYYIISHLVVLFSTNQILNPACNPSCAVTGGGNEISTTTFTLTANTTYYYTSQAGVGGLNINNITSKIASYVNNAAGKSIDTLQLTVYLSSCSSNGVVVFSLSCPYTNFGTYTQQFSIPNGTSKQFIHTPNGTSIPIPINSTYAVGIISKFSGLSIYEALNAQPMYTTNEGTFSGATWTPPSSITIKNTSPVQLFLEWFGTLNLLYITSTSTSTSISTCTSGSVCITGSATTYNTQTTFHYSRANTATPTNDIQDLETYFPVWIFPILFSPFGIQGVLIGFLIGIVLGALLGIIPLWAAFLLSIGIVYIMLRRG